MLHSHKNYLILFFFVFASISIKSETNPYKFIDDNAQKMVKVLTNNSELFLSNREA